MTRNQRVKAILGSLFLMFVLVLASCAPSIMGVETGPRAWVGGPPDGSEVPVGVVSAMCHGYAPGGVAHLELWVNGGFAGRAANPSPGAEYFTENLAFETTGPGSYVLHCRTYAQDGEWVQSAPVTVRVPGEPVPPTATPEEIPSATPTSTGVPTDTPTATGVPTDTPTATGVPTDTPTSTPTSTLTPTPQRVRIVSLEADRTQIVAGECVKFTWRVEAPTEIYFDGEGVGNYPDSRDKCPTSTRSFELRAEGYGGPDIESITIVVIQDTEGPAIGRVGHSPGLIWWDESDSCGPPTYPIEVGINAYNITDPSGVSAVKVAYRVVEVNRPAGQWQAKSMGQVQTGMYSASIGPNDLELSLNPPVTEQYGKQSTLEYYIQAFDGVGNRSDSPTRTLTVQYCNIVK